ncbi:MAG: hypothetical protein CVV44_07185 [Spirochaetae bacterium HGW-Spirochaetae-1]|jgi:hypothetical protein|nr:MAG: hypothetical protein CVV44_07185 [Spirochaetae bacterium HGW-Spirochaetae-1]
MKTITIASAREGAGKTSIIVGLATSLGKAYGYMKPFGDRLIYKRKRNWDYDANLMVNILGIDEDPETISLGFNHSKLKYVYDEARMKETVVSMAANIGKGKDLLFVEGGRDLTYGASVHLDSLSIHQYVGGKLIIVYSGDDDQILDDITHLHSNINLKDVDFAGIIINNVHDVDDFENSHSKVITDMGIPILGIIPFREQLTYFSVNFLSEKLFAKVIAGEKGLSNIVKNIFVGAMSTGESLRNPLFNKENKLLITSGDRSDMILAALESDTVGIVLTNNLLPPSNIIARATEKNVPLLLVSTDTFQVSKQIDRMEALLTPDNEERIKFISQLVTKYVRVEDIIG